MNNQVKLLRNVAVAAGLVLLACTSKNSTAQTENTEVEYTVEEAPEWNSLFIRQSGWFGSDGIYAIPQDGKRYNSPNAKSTNMFIFSDTMIGEIVDGKLGERKMVNNTVAYIKGAEPKKENIEFYWDKDASGKPKSIFIPTTPSTKPGDYYWLGDAFYSPVLKNTYIIAYRMHTMDPKDDWSFREMGTNLIIIPKGSKPPFKDQRQVETPIHFDNHEHGGFGAGIFVNTKEAGAPKPDGYIYIYGNGGLKGKGLLAARVLEKDFENFSAWRFYDGKNWVADMKESAPLATDVSNELSVSPITGGRYALVYELGGMGTTVAMQIGTSPVGPWGPVKKIYESKPEDKKFFHYNAKAHPSLSAPGELLVSYNQNSWDFHTQLVKFPNLYHPYFLKVKFK